MKYLEFTIKTADETASEILIARLSDYPFDGFSEEDGILKAYIREPDFLAFEEAIQTLLDESQTDYAVTEIEEVNWNALWESNFEPIAVEGKCLIRAPFHDPDPAIPCEVVIMPKMAFGTGHHATTYLMAGEILDHDFEGLQGLDMGSGTGVLAILAVRKGALRVEAIDIDEWAYANCSENIVVNHCADRIVPLLGDATLLAGKTYDFILANINRNILLEDMAKYVRALVPDGLLLLSGILERDIPAIKEKAESLGLEFRNQKIRNGWAVVRFVKK